MVAPAAMSSVLEHPSGDDAATVRVSRYHDATLHRLGSAERAFTVGELGELRARFTRFTHATATLPPATRRPSLGRARSSVEAYRPPLSCAYAPHRRCTGSSALTLARRA